MKGTVTIHGKEYETVASRVGKFRTEHQLDYAITTKIIESDNIKVVMKASITNKEGFVVATGHAEEKRDSSIINKTSALENCETSAIGRALAAFGLAGTEYATADEVATAITNQQASPKKLTATVKQLETMFSLVREKQGYTDQSLVHEWLTDRYEKDPREMDVKEASDVISELMEMDKVK